MTPFPQALRQFRESKGLTRRELAKRWNCSKRCIENWEQGARKPTPEGPMRLLMLLDSKGD